MKRLMGYACTVVLLAGLLFGCQGNLMSQSEKLFIKMVNKTAGKLDLDENQKVQLERLKMDIRKNFLEGQEEKDEAAAEINLTLNFQSNLSDIQKKKLTRMITKWVTED